MASFEKRTTFKHAQLAALATVTKSAAAMADAAEQRGATGKLIVRVGTRFVVGIGLIFTVQEIATQAAATTPTEVIMFNAFSPVPVEVLVDWQDAGADAVAALQQSMADSWLPAAKHNQDCVDSLSDEINGKRPDRESRAP